MTKDGDQGRNEGQPSWRLWKGQVLRKLADYVPPLSLSSSLDKELLDDIDFHCV